jgi:hypothetical protein
MLLAKINPAASFTSQDGPFAQPTVITAEYLSAAARPYVAGASQTNFEVVFGTYTPSVEALEGVQAQSAKFNRVQSSQVVLSAEELASWGTDDSVLLDAIAAKLGTSVTETVTVTGNMF